MAKGKNNKSKKQTGFVSSVSQKSRKLFGMDERNGSGSMKRGKTPLSETLDEKFKKQTLKDHLTRKVGNHNQIVGAVVGAAGPLIVSYVTGKLIPKEDGFDQYERSPVYYEEDRIGAETGALYKKFLKITIDDKLDRQMKYAKGLYKVENWPAFDSKSKKYWKSFQHETEGAYESLFAQAGEMRQGVWFPDSLISSGSVLIDWRDKAMYQMWSGRLLTKMAMYFELRQFLMTDADRTWLDQSDNQSADKFYAINYIDDIVTIANGMEYSPVDLKIYVCKCKSQTQYSPAACWFNPVGEATPLNHMRNDYVYPQSTPDLSTLPSPAFAGLQPISHYGNASVHLGSSPFYSPTFRNHWTVEDVVKQQILPTDKFELHFKREFRKATSIRELEQERDDSSAGGGARAPFCVGDYALLITFRGKAGFMRYTGDLAAGQEGLRETDVTPSKILVTSRSSFGISSPNLINSDATPGTSKQTENYIAGEGRVLDTELQTLDFTNTDWKPEVVTNVAVKEGGAR